MQFQDYLNIIFLLVQQNHLLDIFLGAAGSVESIFSIMSLNNNILPATLNLDNPIETSNINLIPKKPIEKNISYALSNSFGFGGTNTALLFKSI